MTFSSTLLHSTFSGFQESAVDFQEIEEALMIVKQRKAKDDQELDFLLKVDNEKVRGQFLCFVLHHQYCCSKIISYWVVSLFQVMICHLFNTKPSTEPVLTYCELWALRNKINLGKSFINTHCLYIRIYSIFCLQNGNHFLWPAAVWSHHPCGGT